MTTATANTAFSTDLRVSQRRVILSEWTKLRSLRSTLFTLLAAVVLSIGIGILFTAVTAAQWVHLHPAERASFNPVTASLSGITFSQLAIGVLGIMLITGEYSTGMIRASLTAVPHRLPVLWGKIAVFVGVVGVLSLITSFSSFFLGQTMLATAHRGLNVGLSAPDALRQVIGSALYVVVAGVLAMAIGTLLRNTAASISTFVALFFVVPPLLSLLPASFTTHVSPYLPAAAGQAVWSTRATVSMAPWTGFALFCGYAVVLVALAAWRLRRSDA